MQPIYLIRHGQTALNAARAVQLPETPLDERGLSQAAALASRLASGREPAIASIVASDYRRAHQTAEAIAGATGVPLRLEPLLRERNFGDLRGKSYHEIDADLFAPDFEPPGGESVPSFNQRVDAAWAAVCRLASESDGPLAVVSHGLVCAAVLTHCLSDATRPEGVDTTVRGFGNTALSIIRGPEPWHLELVGCCAHLEPSRAG